MVALSDAERARAYRERQKRKRSDGVISEETQELVNELRSERKMTAGEQLLVKHIALCNQELDEFETLVKGGGNPPWLRAIEDRLGTGEIVLNIDGIHAAIDRKRSTLARLLAELRQYGLAAAKASAQKSAPPTAAPLPVEPVGLTPPTVKIPDEYSDLFATG